MLAISKCPVIKLPVDKDDSWSDTMSFYKSMPFKYCRYPLTNTLADVASLDLVASYICSFTETSAPAVLSLYYESRDSWH